MSPSPDGPVGAREGYEEAVTVNALGPFLLALLLLPMLRRRPAPDEADDNIVGLCFVTSSAHHFARFPQRHAPRVFEALRDGGDMNDRCAVTELLVVLLVLVRASTLASIPYILFFLNKGGTRCVSGGSAAKDLYRTPQN